jgi:hypothetical protein
VKAMVGLLELFVVQGMGTVFGGDDFYLRLIHTLYINAVQ